MPHRDKIHGVPRARLDALRAVPFFEGLPDKELARIDHLLKEIEVPAGTLLMVEKAKPRSAFVIVEGVADVRIGGEIVREATTGELIGELGLLQSSVRSATVVARTAMRLLVVDSKDFRWILDNAPLAERVVENVIRHRNGAEG